MPISIDAVYAPLSQFFTQKFGLPTGDGLSFHFADRPLELFDTDFVPPDNPALGPQAVVAAEVGSQCVDAIPVLGADGTQQVIFDTQAISAFYHDRLLQPAFAAPNASDGDDVAAQRLIDTFADVKANALKSWLAGTVSSVRRFDTIVALSSLDPSTWWDPTDLAPWTHQTLLAKGAATTVDGPTPIVWRMRPDLEQFRKTSAYLALQDRMKALQSAASRRATMMTLSTSNPAAAPVFRRDIDPSNAPALSPSEASFSRWRNVLSSLPTDERASIDQAAAHYSTTQTVEVSDVQITFDFCGVIVHRPWFDDAFIAHPAWAVPGFAAGSLSRHDAKGLPAIPIGFVAVRNLSIGGPWTASDLTSLALADQFGPFNIDGQVVDGAVHHTGLQIVGWMLRTMPALPPRSA